MRYCTLLHTFLILYCFLAKGSKASSSSGGDPAGHQSYARRFLQGATANSLLEYDPVFDVAVELQALTALYEATGGKYWTYGSYFSENPTLGSASGNNTAMESLALRFQQTAWLDASVSYCQW